MMRTPLYQEHVKIGARMVDFHGWKMPVWYTGIKEEHLAVRRDSGVFDICHMGEIFISGPESTAYLDSILTRDIPSMKPGQALYTFFLNQAGGIIDDLIVYCLDLAGNFMLCVNSSNKDKDYEWMRRQNSFGAVVEDRSEGYAAIALQGPKSGRILNECLGFDYGSLRPFRFSMLRSPEYGNLMISRTGYTGAGGVEIFFPKETAPALWRAFITSGAVPCGLGARDTLRLEMGYPLHGNDLSEETTPLEADLGFALDMKKTGFIGKQALLDQQNRGIIRRLTGMELLDRGVPREGCTCLKDGKAVGVLTSGSVSPVTSMGIALGYLDVSVQESDEVSIDVRGRLLRSKVKKPPFVKGTL
jgi:aminomethyltransferase